MSVREQREIHTWLVLYVLEGQGTNSLYNYFVVITNTIKITSQNPTMKYYFFYIFYGFCADITVTSDSNST